MAFAVLSAAYPTMVSSRGRGVNHAPGPHVHEMAAAFGFLAIPIIAVTVSMLTTGAFTDRYALPAVIGCSLVVAFAAHESLFSRPAAVAILALFLCACFLSLGAKSFTSATAIREANVQAAEFLRSKAVGDLPIAVSDQHAFMSLVHYAPRDIGSRLIYLADAGKALGEDVRPLQEKAAALKKAINAHFWQPDKGYYGYFIDDTGTLNPRMEGLGEAFAILTGVAAGREVQILNSTPTTAWGFPCLWPQFEEWRDYKRDFAHYYHNGMIWPFVQG